MPDILLKPPAALTDSQYSGVCAWQAECRAWQHPGHFASIRGARPRQVAVTSEKPAFEVATPAAHAERMWELHTAHPIAPLRCVLSEEQVAALLPLGLPSPELLQRSRLCAWRQLVCARSDVRCHQMKCLTPAPIRPMPTASFLRVEFSA